MTAAYSELDEFRFAKLGFIRRPKPLLSRIDAGEIKIGDVVALSERDLGVQMKRGFMSLKNAWLYNGWIEGKSGGIKLDLTRAGKRKEDSTAKYVIFLTSPVFEFHIPLDEYKNVSEIDSRGRQRTRRENKAIVPQAFKIIDDFLEANTGMMWPYLTPQGEFGVTFESETDGILFSAMVTVNVQDSPSEPEE